MTIFTKEICEVNCMLKQRFNAVGLKLKALTTIIAKTKSVAEQGKLLPFVKLLKNYQIKKIIYTSL